MIKKLIETRHSLRWKIFAVVMALGICTTQMIYIPYSRYIKKTYQEKLATVLKLVDVDYHHFMSDPDNLVRLGTEGADEYWEFGHSMRAFADVFEMTYIYLVQPVGNDFLFVFSSQYTKGTPPETIFELWDPDVIPEALTAAYKTKTINITKKPYTDQWGTFITGFYPVIENGKVVSILGADYNFSKVKGYEQSSQILLLIAMIIGTVATFLLSSSLIRPIVKLFGVLKTIAAGDLTQPIETKGKDEIATMTLLLKETQGSIRNLVKSIKGEADVLSDIGSDLASNMNETAAAVNEITANIQSIKGRVINQSASVTETHATMENVVTNINKLDGLVEKQGASVSQVSSAIEQMAANIQSVTTTLADNAANVKTLQEASEAGRGRLQEVATDIQEISRESEGLLEINSVMENIASQTNLLSMNAAIEAAHAGEAGKGFAVVADEIRKLAESSSEQSKTISNVLKKIKGSIDKIIRSTENVLTGFEAIDSSVKVVSEQEGHILGAMEEQGTGSRKIVDGVTQVNEITAQVKSGSHEMLEGSTEVIKESTELDKATQEISSGMNEMASGAQQVNVAVNHVKEISGKNRNAVDVLLKEVARFKVE